MNAMAGEYETVFVRRKVVSRSLVDGRKRTSMPEYRIWTGMMARCSNPKLKAFANYGGRGITVCLRWREDFENFYSDMGARPSSRHSIDRIDNDGNYEPGNCRWATPSEQILNRRDSHNFWSPKDYETLKRMYLGYYPLEEIAMALDRSVQTIRLRIHIEKLHREAFITKLASKNPDFRHFLHNGDREGFLHAVTNRREARVKKVEAQLRHSLERIAERAREIVRSSDSRNAKMRSMREAGLSLSAIGRHFSITRERVRQLEEAGFPDREGETSGDRRKISKTNPAVRRKKIDRLCRAWNAASREARVEFLAAAPGYFFKPITVDEVVAAAHTDEAAA